MSDAHGADLYGEKSRVLPTCRCGWKGEWVPTYDEAADTYAAHRLESMPLERVGWLSDDQAAAFRPNSDGDPPPLEKWLPAYVLRETE